MFCWTLCCLEKVILADDTWKEKQQNIVHHSRMQSQHQSFFPSAVHLWRTQLKKFSHVSSFSSLGRLTFHVCSKKRSGRDCFRLLFKSTKCHHRWFEDKCKREEEEEKMTKVIGSSSPRNLAFSSLDRKIYPPMLIDMSSQLWLKYSTFRCLKTRIPIIHICYLKRVNQVKKKNYV